MKYIEKTEKGLVRKENQDYFLVDISKGIFIIADGIGGLSNGGLASKIATESCFKSISDYIDSESSANDVEAIREAIFNANDTVRKISGELEINKLMGTTLSCAIIRNNIMSYGYIGDSRIYIKDYLQNKITRITRDHTIVEEMIKKGMPPSLIKNNILTKSVGIHNYIEPSVGQVDVCSNDLILMCTDGLTGHVKDNLLSSILSEHINNIENAANLLIDTAQNNGSSDNISVIIIRI